MTAHRYLAPGLVSALLATTLLSMPAYSQGRAHDRRAGEVADDHTIVVTASATSVEVRDAPASISVITREEIERRPVQSLGEVLGRLPGVTGGVSPTGAMSKINIRGLPDNYTLLLVDGRRVGNSRDISYRPDLGRQDLNWISPDMIERIEVVRGPMSSIYGSDAMGGVINIITRRIAPTWRGSFNTSYTKPEDSDRGDAYQFGFNASGPLAEQVGIRLGGTYSRLDPDEIVLANNNGTAGVINKNINGVLTFRAAEGQIFSAEGSYGLEQPVAPETRTATGGEQAGWGSDTKRTNFRASHEGEWGFGTSRIDVYRNAFVNRDVAAEGEAAKFHEWIVDGIVNFETNLLVLHKVAVGGQFRDEQLTNDQTIGTIPVDYDGNVIQGSTLKGRTWALFLEDQITLAEPLLLTLGGRLDSHQRYGENFSPRAYLVWHPMQALTLRGGVSRGFRAPSLKENSAGAATFSRGGGCSSLTGLGYTGGGCYMAGNPDLKPEESTNYEVGAAYDQGGTSLSATFFNTNFRNKIQYAALGFFQGRWWTMMENIQRARTRGMEFSASVRPFPELTVRANATWMMKAKNLDTGDNLITAPKLSGFASVDWQALQRLTLSVTAQHTGKELAGGGTITEAYTLFDVAAAFRATRELVLRAGVQNMFKKTITGTGGFGYYSPGRRFFVGATTRF